MFVSLLLWLLLFIFLSFCALIAYIYWIYHPKMPSEWSHLQQPKEFAPFMGHAIGIAKSTNPDDAMQTWYDWIVNYGVTSKEKVFVVKILHGWWMIIHEPQHMKELLVDKAKDFSRDVGFDYDVAAFDAEILFAISGPSWKHRRTRLNPSFRTKLVEQKLLPLTVKQAQHTINEMLAGDPKHVDFQFDHMQKMTLRIIYEFLTSRELTEKQLNSLTSFMKSVGSMAAFLRPLDRRISWIIQPFLLGYKKTRNEYKETLKQMIQTRRNELKNEEKTDDEFSEQARDVLESLIRSNDNLSDTDISTELEGLLFAGHDTTKGTLCFMLWELMKNPSSYRKLQSEIDATFPLDFDFNQLTNEQLSKMNYLNAVINETLRLHPAGPAHISTAINDTTIAGQPIRKGGIIMAVPYATQRLPQFWGANGIDFIPERWEKKNKDEGYGDAVESFASGHTGNAKTYLPFLIGPHGCIGQHLALFEIKIFTCILLRKYEISIPDRTEFDKITPMIDIVLHLTACTLSISERKQ